MLATLLAVFIALAIADAVPIAASTLMAEPKQPPGKNGFKYREQYGVIALCKSEREQQTVFNKLKKQGFTVRVVTV